MDVFAKLFKDRLECGLFIASKREGARITNEKKKTKSKGTTTLTGQSVLVTERKKAKIFLAPVAWLDK